MPCPCERPGSVLGAAGCVMCWCQQRSAGASSHLPESERDRVAGGIAGRVPLTSRAREAIIGRSGRPRRRTMRKVIAEAEVRGKLEQVLDGVEKQGDQYVIERDGTPMAAVVPLWVLEQIERTERKCQ